MQQTTFRFLRRAPLAAAGFLACLATGCSSASNPLASTTTTAASLTNEYTGVLTLNGAQSFPFVVAASGQITAQLVSVTPDVATIVGFGIGVWDGAACQVAPGVWNDRASSGTAVVGQASGAGSLCVRIYDSQGTLPNPENFDIIVLHP